VPRFDRVDPLVMLAIVRQWLLLATIVGAVVGSSAALFRKPLFCPSDQTASAPFRMQMASLTGAGEPEYTYAETVGVKRRQVTFKTMWKK